MMASPLPGNNQLALLLGRDTPEGRRTFLHKAPQSTQCCEGRRGSGQDACSPTRPHPAAFFQMLCHPDTQALSCVSEIAAKKDCKDLDVKKNMRKES